MKKKEDQKVWWGRSGTRVRFRGKSTRYPFVYPSLLGIGLIDNACGGLDPRSEGGGKGGSMKSNENLYIGLQFSK
jgi:hypothetical protein